MGTKRNEAVPVEEGELQLHLNIRFSLMLQVDKKLISSSCCENMIAKN